MASNNARPAASAKTRLPWPTIFELRELVIRAVLLPFVVAPRPVGLLVARVMAAYILRERGPAMRSRRKRLPPELPAKAAIPADRMIREFQTQAHYEQILLLRGIVFPWWRRRLRVTGLRHVRSGLAAGNGVILWVHPCLASNVAVKQAMFLTGHPLAHLSRPSHPFASAPFGVRYINPVFRRPEARFLAERVVINDNQTIAPLRRLRKLLKENCAVSITVTASATRVNEFEMLGGMLRLPAGPLELAAATGAVVLPVFTWASGSKTTVEIGAPLPIGDGSAAAVREAQAEAARWLERHVVAHPIAWIGWRHGTFRAG